MKRVLLLSTMVILTVTLSVNSQTFGAKAGLNIATITGDDTSDVDSRTSFHVGAIVEFELSDQFAFQPELIYSSQGAKGSEEGMDVTMKLDYLNVPLMAKYYVSEGFSLEAGPQIGFLLSADMELDYEGESMSVDIKDEMKSIDFGLNFGLAYKLDSGLNFGARYNLGLSNIWDYEDDMDDSENQNSVFQISVGYNF